MILQEEEEEENDIFEDTETEIFNQTTTYKQQETDEFGYLLRMRTLNDPTKPSYQLDSLQESSMFHTISKIVFLKHEGLLSIWKGSFDINQDPMLIFYEFV